MNRKKYLQRQKEEHGRGLLGVFPALYPRELLWALNILPAEIWDPPLRVRAADAHLQPYICPVVKQGLELILRNKADLLDGFLFPHTCDSIQNLASVVHDYIGLDKPCFFFNHPREPHGPSARVYYRRALGELAEALAPRFGPLDQDQLQRRVDQGREITRLTAEVYARRARGESALDNRGFYQALRRGEWLWPEDFAAELKAMLSASGRPKAGGPPIILSGVLPTSSLLGALDDLGAPVVQDDLLVAGRRLPAAYPAEGDPWDRLVEAYFSLPPCSARTSSLRRRRDHLLGLIKQTGAAGVIFHIVKFCETELFDAPTLMDELKAHGVPSLIIEAGLGAGADGQTATRAAAFLEMLS